MNPTLAVFAKSPVAGHVKTRLCPPLTLEAAAHLSAAFFADTVMKAVQMGRCPTVYFDGPHEKLESVLTENIAWQPQGAGDLGARLARVPAPCVIVGTDSPTLPVGIFDEAVSRLQDADVVLGPARDGGYYLIGLRAPQPSLFEGIAWSTGDVMAQTLARARENHLTVARLPLWYDVDTGDDLIRLREDLAASPPDFCPATRAVLETLP